MQPLFLLPATTQEKEREPLWPTRPVLAYIWHELTKGMRGPPAPHPCSTSGVQTRSILDSWLHYPEHAEVTIAAGRPISHASYWNFYDWKQNSGDIWKGYVCLSQKWRPLFCEGRRQFHQALFIEGFNCHHYQLSVGGKKTVWQDQSCPNIVIVTACVLRRDCFHNLNVFSSHMEIKNSGAGITCQQAGLPRATIWSKRALLFLWCIKLVFSIGYTVLFMPDRQVIHYLIYFRK